MLSLLAEMACIGDLESDWTVLHRALYYGNFESALWLLKKFPDLLSTADREECTPVDILTAQLGMCMRPLIHHS